ncbi:S66 family peptidase [Clostridium cellulovorans]|uniref:Peptidase U61 LD-carboxypeptidase A n=1 Tax=Clostridium cellulovorans (strain ATCC 35296 / DSM 3052 / OCM 3 / 743B) TaxID=573061 RepID=D9SRT4_CLOC7|nr:S66 peptidase family protein [Clostridium cellulovorans]ADL50451.1 peptidase U61 LD-carboxypeptidase A [Clostridium cellulovorans 743B]
MLKTHDKIGIVACSNGLKLERKNNIDKLIDILEELGIRVVTSKYIFTGENFSISISKEKASELMTFFKDDEIKAIFDLSGGDLANGILEYLDYQYIKKNPKPFYGYSDLTVVLNAIYSKTGIPTYNYQIRNLVGEFSSEQKLNFEDTFFNNGTELYDIKPRWINGDKIEGVVIGGNIRCFLKLAGTEYIPNLKNKVLLLEALSGDIAKITTFLNQYKQMGVFDEISGIILGTFTEMEKNSYKPSVEEILMEILDGKNIPIVKTEYIGHQGNSRAIAIGGKILLKRE